MPRRWRPSRRAGPRCGRDGCGRPGRCADRRLRTAPGPANRPTSPSRSPAVSPTAAATRSSAGAAGSPDNDRRNGAGHGAGGGCGGGGGGDAASGGRPHRPDPVFAPETRGPLTDRGGRLTRAVVRAAGAVVHSGRAQVPVAARPAGGAGVADLEAFRAPAPQRPTVVHDTPGWTQPPGRCQRGIAWGHEGFLGFGADVAVRTGPEGPHPFKHPARVSPTSRDGTPGRRLSRRPRPPVRGRSRHCRTRPSGTARGPPGTPGPAPRGARRGRWRGRRSGACAPPRPRGG